MAGGGVGAGAGAGAALIEKADAELVAAASSRVKLNILDERTDDDRSFLRFSAVEWEGRDGAEVSFHRGLSDMFAYAAEMNGEVVASSSATGKRAPKVKKIDPSILKKRRIEKSFKPELEEEFDEVEETEVEEEEERYGGGGKSGSPTFASSRAGRYLARSGGEFISPLPTRRRRDEEEKFEYEIGVDPNPVPEREISPVALPGLSDEDMFAEDGKEDKDLDMFPEFDDQKVK